MFTTSNLYMIMAVPRYKKETIVIMRKSTKEMSRLRFHGFNYFYLQRGTENTAHYDKGRV